MLHLKTDKQNENDEIIFTDIMFASTFNYLRDKLSIYNTMYKEMIN